MQRSERVSMEGASFGKLTVIRRTRKTQSPNGSWSQYVLVQCSCGSSPIEMLWSSVKKATSCTECRPGGRFIDISGQVFKHLTVMSFTGKRDNIGSTVWECLCKCGKVVEKSSAYLKHSENPSCGCAAKDNLGTHKMTNSPAHKSWKHMISRAKDDGTNYPGYEDVVVCDKWNPAITKRAFQNFFEDMGPPPKGYTLNRVYGAKLYSKETCEWADLSLQSFDQKLKKTNKSGVTGVKWREDRGVWEARITKNKIIYLLYYGESFQEAVKSRREAELKYYGFTKEGKYE